MSFGYDPQIQPTSSGLILLGLFSGFIPIQQIQKKLVQPKKTISYACNFGVSQIFEFGMSILGPSEGIFYQIFSQILGGFVTLHWFNCALFLWKLISPVVLYLEPMARDLQPPWFAVYGQGVKIFPQFLRICLGYVNPNWAHQFPQKWLICRGRICYSSHCFSYF